MDFRLEVVVLPVTDVDRAKAFYTALGWRQDADLARGPDFRVVQLTPPGSPCSVIFGTGLTAAPPGSADGLQLVVDDIEAARAELARGGADPSEVVHDEGGGFHHAGTGRRGGGPDPSEVFPDEGGVFHHAGTPRRVSGPAPDRASYGSFLSFPDPDGNLWFVQEITTRLPGRVTAADRIPGGGT